MAVFVIEARKQDETKYPSKTIDLLLAVLRRHEGSTAPNFLNEQDKQFTRLHGTRDTVARQLREDGIGAAMKH